MSNYYKKVKGPQLTRPGQNALIPPFVYIDFAVSVMIELFIAFLALLLLLETQLLEAEEGAEAAKEEKEAFAKLPFLNIFVVVVDFIAVDVVFSHD